MASYWTHLERSGCSLQGQVKRLTVGRSGAKFDADEGHGSAPEFRRGKGDKFFALGLRLSYRARFISELDGSVRYSASFLRRV